MAHRIISISDAGVENTGALEGAKPTAAADGRRRWEFSKLQKVAKFSQTKS
jgi:hypothetical protein